MNTFDFQCSKCKVSMRLRILPADAKIQIYCISCNNPVFIKTAPALSAKRTFTEKNFSSAKQKYIFQKAMGECDYSKFYLARDQENKVVTIVLFVNKAEKIREDIDIVADLNHCGLVKYLDYGYLNNQFFAVMEYIDIQNTLDKYIENTFIDVEEAITMTISLLDALEHLHNLGVCHTIINPSNIFITTEKDVKIILDCILYREPPKAFVNDEANRTRLSLGAFYYPLEQIKKLKDMTSVGDIYSVGAVLYYLLSSISPFSECGNDLGKLFSAKIKNNYIRLRERDFNLDSRLGSIVEKAMALEPKDRYQTAAEMAKDLKNLFKKTHWQSLQAPFFSKIKCRCCHSDTYINYIVSEVLKPKIHCEFCNNIVTWKSNNVVWAAPDLDNKKTICLSATMSIAIFNKVTKSRKFYKNLYIKDRFLLKSIYTGIVSNGYSVNMYYKEITFLAFDKQSKQQIFFHFLHPSNHHKIENIIKKNVEKYQNLTDSRVIKNDYEYGHYDVAFFSIGEYWNANNILFVYTKNNVISIDETLKIIMGILDVVEYIHKQNMICEEINPKTVSVGEKVQLILQREHPLKLSEEIHKIEDFDIENIYFKCLEQLNRSTNPNILWSIYSIGAILYYLLCKKMPFAEYRNYITKVYFAKSGNNCIRLAERSSYIPEALIKIVEKAMSIDPQKRYQTIPEMRIELETFFLLP